MDNDTRLPLRIHLKGYQGENRKCSCGCELFYFEPTYKAWTCDQCGKFISKPDLSNGKES